MFSSASFLSFISVASASFAPAAVLASTTVCKQPAHLILAIFAAFLWSCAISVVALVWIALFRPLGAPLWVVALCAVVLQELARWATYALFEAMLRGLRSAGLMPHDGPRTAAQQVPAAVSSGLGAGVMQVLSMHGDVLAGATRPGTLYTPACASLSLFAVDALTNLASTVLNVLLSVLGWTAAYPRKSRRAIGMLVVLHLLAAGATLLNTQLPSLVPAGSGCAYSLPCLYAVVLVCGVLTARIAAISVCAPRRRELMAGGLATSATRGER